MRFLAPALVLCMAATAFASVDRQLISLTPPDATLLGSIDVKQTSSSPFGQYMLKEMHSDRDFKEFITATGFDPRRDLESILFAGLGRQTPTESRFVVLAKGNFDAARVQTALRAKGFVPSRFHGAQLLTLKDPKRTIAAAFPQSGVIALGDIDTVHEVLAPAASSSIDPKLTEQINLVSGNDIWYATLLSGGFIAREIAGTMPQLQSSDLLQTILESAGGVRFGTEINVSLDLTAKTSEDAQSLTDLLRLAANLAQMHTTKGQFNFLGQAFNGMQVSTNGQLVTALLTIPEDQVEAHLAQRAK